MLAIESRKREKHVLSVHRSGKGNETFAVINRLKIVDFFFWGGGIENTINAKEHASKDVTLRFHFLLVSRMKTQRPQDGILGHQFNKRLESFTPCYSQSLLLADFKENNRYSSLILKILFYKKIRETRKL
jgi:hypothetical protein